MVEYKLTGDPKEIAKILRENQIRVARGLVSFTPLAEAESDGKELPEADGKELPEADGKGVPAGDGKKPVNPKKRK